MPCQHVRLPGGGTAIVCGSRSRPKRCSCGSGLPADLLCDWKRPEKKSGTCDKPLCERCSTKPAPDKDLCPEHAKAWEAWKAEVAQKGKLSPDA